MARVAKENAARAEAGVSAINTRLDGFILSMDSKWNSIRDDMRRAEDRRDADQKEWRKTLGDRLDRQDKGQWAVAGLVVAALLSIVGFLIAHLPIFK